MVEEDARPQRKMETILWLKLFLTEKGNSFLATGCTHSMEGMLATYVHEKIFLTDESTSSPLMGTQRELYLSFIQSYI